MTRPLTMLLLSAGRRVELMECFRKDAKHLGIPLRIIAIDAAPEYSAACARADLAVAAPRCTAPEYGEFLLDLCRREKAAFVVPTIDPELLPLAELAGQLTAEGTRAVVSGPATVALSRDKARTAAVLGQSGIAVPRTADAHNFDPSASGWEWPVIVKPRGGSSSKGIRTVSQADYAVAPSGRDDIVQERLIAPEFTVNVFFSAEHCLKAAVPHRRLETRGGEVSKAETVRDAQLESIARGLESVLPDAVGPMCFQAMQRSDGKMAVFEINARFGGGFPVAHHAGAPFTRWLLEEVAGLPTTASDDWREGVRMLRYDSAVFL